MFAAVEHFVWPKSGVADTHTHTHACEEKEQWVRWEGGGGAPPSVLGICI